MATPRKDPKSKPTPKRKKSVKVREAAKKRGLPDAALAHRFAKGNKGKPKGTKNKLGVKLKEAILEAAELSGADGKGTGGAVGYLVWLSRAEPAVYGRMLEKIMPMQLEVKDKSEGAGKLTPQEAIDRLNERGLPVPPSLTTLAANVGKGLALREDADYEAELNGEDIEDEQADEEDEDAAEQEEESEDAT